MNNKKISNNDDRTDSLKIDSPSQSKRFLYLRDNNSVKEINFSIIPTLANINSLTDKLAPLVELNKNINTLIAPALANINSFADKLAPLVELNKNINESIAPILANISSFTDKFSSLIELNDHVNYIADQILVNINNQIKISNIESILSDPSTIEFFQNIPAKNFKEDAFISTKDLKILEENLIERIDNIATQIADRSNKDRIQSILISFFVGIIVNVVTMCIENLLKTDSVYVERDNIEVFSGSSNYRISHSTDIAIRRKPSSKSEILGILPSNTLVRVWDKSNRSWLLISAEINNEIIFGWIYRRYTKSYEYPNIGD